MKQFYQELLDNLRAQPGVQSAGYARAAVLAEGAWGDGVLVEGHIAKDGENTHAQVTQRVDLGRRQVANQTCHDSSGMHGETRTP